MLNAVAAAPETEATENSAPSSSAKPAEFFFDFLSYRYDLHNRVNNRWKGLVRANRDKLRPSKVEVRFYINARGVVSAIESTHRRKTTSEKSNEQKLAEYALALENENPVEFPESVRREYQKGFFYKITLTVE